MSALDEYLELANKLRIASRLPIYSDGVKGYFTEAADAIEELVRREQGAMAVLERATQRMRSANQHLRDAMDANEEIRNG